MKVNMTPNPLDVVTIHASQGDTEAREWEFELHNNGELIDTSEVSEQMFFKAYKGGTEQILPENGSVPTTAPFLGDIKYPQGILSDQEFLYRESPTEEDGNAKITSIKGNTLVWNQLASIRDRSFTDRGITVTTANGKISYSGTTTAGSSPYIDVTNSFIDLSKIIAGHKYLISVHDSADDGGWNRRTYIAINNPYTEIPVLSQTASRTIIFTPNATPTYALLRIAIGREEGVNLNGNASVVIVDLTQMGLDITDPSEFTSLFPLPYYAYNQGSLLSFNGNGIKTVGENQLNLGDSKSATANGVTASYDASTQKVTLSGTNTKTDSAYIIINFTPSAIPKFKIGETYVISASSQIPTNTYFNLVYRDTNNALQGLSLTQIETRRVWRFTVPSNYSTFNSFQIGILKEARQLNGEFGVQLEFGTQATAYEPYTSSALSLPISTYFPTGMKSVGNVYDELTESKAITRVGSRAYQSGDESDTSVITDGTTTYYALVTPTETSFTTASLVTENAEIPLSNEDGTLIGKCTEQLSENPGFIDAKIKLSDADGECYSNKLQLHVERSPQ